VIDKIITAGGNSAVLVTVASPTAANPPMASPRAAAVDEITNEIAPAGADLVSCHSDTARCPFFYLFYPDYAPTDAAPPLIRVGPASVGDIEIRT